MPTILACCWLALGGCNLEGEGDPPPRGLIDLPMGVALSADERYLFVLNSNFGRRYSAGTLQSYDLAKLDGLLCDEADLGLGCELDPGDALVSEVRIGSIGRTLVASPSGHRLYVPTHADGALTYVEVDDSGHLSCGGSTDCSDRFRRGVDGASSAGGYHLPVDPIGLAVAPLSSLPCEEGACVDEGEPGEAVIVIHRGGQLSLFVDVRDADGVVRPRLTHVLEGGVDGLTGISQDPETHLFLLTNAVGDVLGAKVLSRVGVYLQKERTESFLFEEGLVPLRGVGPGRNTWAVGSVAEEVSAGAGLLVVAQNPASLVRLEFDRDAGEAFARTVTEVGPGAARLAVKTLLPQDADAAAPLGVAVVSCYADRRLYVIDTVRGEVLSILPGFNGPFEVVIDSGRRRAYVADFRASVVRLVDLAPLLEREPARILAMLGHPQALEELQ